MTNLRHAIWSGKSTLNEKGMGRRPEDGYFFVNGALTGRFHGYASSQRFGGPVTVRDDVLRDELNSLTPRLRRYARALTSGTANPSELADDLVHATLMRALGARHIGAPAELLIRLYATVTQLNREIAVSSQQARAAGAGRPTLIATGPNFSSARQTQLSAGLLGLSLEAREALLLVGLEGFGYAEAARILRISRSVLISRLTQARTALDAALRTSTRQGQAALNRGLHNQGTPDQATLSQGALQRHNVGQGGTGTQIGNGQRRSRAPYLRLVT